MGQIEVLLQVDPLRSFGRFNGGRWDSVKHGKHTGGQQVRQICGGGGGDGDTIHGDLFVACDVCGFPVQGPCYEHERKGGNQACPHFKTKCKRHRGSPPIHGEEGGDGDVDDVSDFNYSTGGQYQKQKIAERMQSWQMNHGSGEDAGLLKYDCGEIHHGHIPICLVTASC